MLKNKSVGSLKLLTFASMLFLVTACGALGTLPLDASAQVTVESVQESSSVSWVVTSFEEPVAAIPTATASPLLLSAGDLQATLIQIYQQANPSVVYILTSTGSGSGFVYDTQGHIVTNRHVVVNSSTLEVIFSNGERTTARLVGADVDSDLAVIKVENLPDGVSPLSLVQGDNLQVGQFVVAIGNPFGEQGSMSFGIVSGLGRSLPSQRTLTTTSTYMLPEVIQTDAPINPGNSGGPLLDLQGRVAGVTSAIASQTGTNSGVGFSIPVKAVHLIVPHLIESGRYEYPYLGVGFDGEINLSEATLYGLEQTQGVYILTVTNGSPADRAGLVAADSNTGKGGDLVIAIDGQPVQNFADLNSYLIFEAAVGQTIELTVFRNGRQVDIPLTLGSRP